MRIYADKLTEHLQHKLLPVYLVFGAEPLLLQESRQALVETAQQQGFLDKHQFVANASLDWNDIYNACQAMSLFASRQIIEIEIPDSGFNATINKGLLELAPLLHPDILLIIVGNKLTKAQEKTKWFKALHSQGALISCLTPDIQRLPQFVQIRCRKLGLTPDPEAIQMLAQWHEGNLLALVQSLEKLTLLYPDGQLTLVRLEQSLSRHNHFTTFHWIDALLAGKANRAQRILRQLNGEGTEAIILLRSLQKELLLLMKMSQQKLQMPMAKVYDKHFIWQSKRPLYNAALERLSPQKIQRQLRLLTQAELLAKTQYEQTPWPLLSQISVEFCSSNTTLTLGLN